MVKYLKGWGALALVIAAVSSVSAETRPVPYPAYPTRPVVRGQSPDAGWGDEYCDPWGRPCRVRGRVPSEKYRFQYQVPRGLTYPAANAPPAVIQYPYYTVKGPDCFFYNGSTTRF